MKKVKYLFMMLIVVMGAGIVQAVTVNNFSFEDDGVLDPGIPTGWTQTAGAATDIGVDSGAGTISDGLYYMWHGNGSVLSQTTGVVIGAAGVSYTLTVDVYNSWDANPQIILYYDDAGTPVQLGEAHYLSSDDWSGGLRTLELTAVTTAASVGKNLGITLSIEDYPGNKWAHYDNVRLVNNTVVLDSPADNATLMPLNTDLEWTVAPTVDTIDLYFGTDPNWPLPTDKKLASEPNTTTSYSPTLSYGPTPTYYWQVVAYEGAVMTESDVYSFTTAGPSPLIQSMTPYGQSVPGDVGADPTITVTGINLEFYEWKKDEVTLTDGVKYGGLGSATLTVNDMTLSDEGIYSCVVTNSLSGDADTATAVIVTERLMSWWKLDGNLNDSVQEVVAGAPQFNGILDPCTIFTTDSSGIDGGNSLELLYDPNTPNIPIAGTEEVFNFYEDSITVSSWVRTSYVSSSAWPAVVSKSPYEPLGIFVSLDGESEALTDIDGTRAYTDGPGLADGQWHMVTMTYDGSVHRTYVDGYLEATSGAVAADASANTAPVIIGAWNFGSLGSDFEGNIDDVQIYSYALTPVEVAEAYTQMTPADDYVCVQGLVNPAYDLNGDCRVNLADFADFAMEWLGCGRIPDTFCLD